MSKQVTSKEMDELIEKTLLAKVNRAITIIQNLLEVLPDGQGNGDKCWDWCWNELNDESQGLVIKVRGEAEMFIINKIS
ncbi:MAG: hypothetical protein PHG61_07275, partial [Candidatus Marinimicrobia bacterium]|nr:hypothetical protein [Candidatus Neomarinimicrobiota bacterium]